MLAVRIRHIRKGSHAGPDDGAAASRRITAWMVRT
jgi:hypothetical protein